MQELAHILAQHWDNVENTYIDGTKFVFRQIRDERENIIRYFYSIRFTKLVLLHPPVHYLNPVVGLAVNFYGSQ